jgi:hypothetical protein
LAEETKVWVPLAICTPDVERVVLPPQDPPLPPLTDPHVMVTAVIGIVGQEVKVAGAVTFRFQDAANDPLVVQLTTALDEPLTTGRFVGSVAENVIDAGETAVFEMVVENGSRGATVAGETFPEG